MRELEKIKLENANKVSIMEEKINQIAQLQLCLQTEIGQLSHSVLSFSYSYSSPNC